LESSKSRIQSSKTRSLATPDIYESYSSFVNTLCFILSRLDINLSLVVSNHVNTSPCKLTAATYRAG